MSVIITDQLSVDTLVEQTNTAVNRVPAHLRIVNAMPEIMVNHLSMIAERWKIDRWVIGRFASELIDWLETGEGRVLMVSTMDAYDAVAHVLQYEVAPRTVRLYCSASRFFPKDIIKNFDHLPYSRFIDAMTYGERSTEVLRWCDEFQSRNGSPPSESLLRENFNTSHIPPDAHPVDLEEGVETIAFIDGAENVDAQVFAYGTEEIANAHAELEGLWRRVEAFYFVPDGIRGEFKEQVDQMQQRLDAMLVILEAR